MDENTSNSTSSADSPTETITQTETERENTPSTTKPVSSERREAYGTAKTENLRDSGLWRIILPLAIAIFCLALFIIPLIILVPLLISSIDGLRTGNATEGQLLWVWITMIVIEVGVCIVVARGLLRVFMTQAGNYSHAR